jgi:hypothetical protein
MVRRIAAILAALALILTACGAPSAPALTDPKEILTKSAVALKDVKTLHVQIDIAGKVTADLTGGGSSGGQLDLAGTTATLDVDVVGQKLKATGTAPALLNSGGELLVVDNAVYYKITGPFAQGDKYTKVALPNLAGLASPSVSSAVPSLTPQQVIDKINEALGKLPTAPTKGADEKCGDVDCYRVTIHLGPADLAKLASQPPSPATAPFDGTLDFTMDVWTRKPDLRPAKFVIAVTAGGRSPANVTTTITATYDAAVTIAAPPADQVVEGSLPFPVPSTAP